MVLIVDRNAGTVPVNCSHTQLISSLVLYLRCWQASRQLHRVCCDVRGKQGKGAVKTETTDNELDTNGYI